MIDFSRIAALGTAHLSDACRAIGRPVAIAGERLRPIVPFSRLAGRAVTMRVSLADGPLDYVDQAVREFEAGRSVPSAVLVIRNDVPGYDSLGAFDGRLAVAGGYVGCVTDGAVRDTADLAQILPVFATSIRPDCLRIADLPGGRSIRLELGVPIDVAGAPIRPGDVVVADNDGVIAFASGGLEEVVAAAAATREWERERLARLDSGAPLRDLLRPP